MWTGIGFVVRFFFGWFDQGTYLKSLMLPSVSDDTVCSITVRYGSLCGWCGGRNESDVDYPRTEGGGGRGLKFTNEPPELHFYANGINNTTISSRYNIDFQIQLYCSSYTYGKYDLC
jgi:hypothetical protein